MYGGYLGYLFTLVSTAHILVDKWNVTLDENTIVKSYSWTTPKLSTRMKINHKKYRQALKKFSIY